MRNLVLPQISINGTSRESLVNQQREVIEALDSVVAKMAEAMPHGRDYQHRPAEYAGARDAWCERLMAVVIFKDEITKHALAIQDPDADLRTKDAETIVATVKARWGAHD